ncbi:MAG: alanyl-tRNA editing protein [Candidatus Micrarchaeota archaeon]|nr:alanyl-tRNA editing protein [Candidatus Micrarchaeota archaeon]
MADALYLRDSYLKTCSAKVVSVKDGKFVVLDQSVFYPRGGGQPWDTGKLVRGSEEFPVVAVVKADGAISHEVSKPGLAPGDSVTCEIDWNRRHRLMRMHTAGHILSAIMFKAGILITGNQLDTDKTRFDFSMENFDRTAFQSLIDKANAEIARNQDVSIAFLPREEAMKIEGAVKLAVALPPEIKELRMVRIGDVDYQADGGTHVKNTSEIGKIIFLGAENKGKNNRRITYGLEP